MNIRSKSIVLFCFIFFLICNTSLFAKMHFGVISATKSRIKELKEKAVAPTFTPAGSQDITISCNTITMFPSSVPASGGFTNVSSRNYILQTVVYELGSNPVDWQDNRHQLRWNFADFSNQHWDAFVYPISRSGKNLRNYKHLEIMIFATDEVILNVDIGIVGEDSNGNSRLNFEGDRLNKIAEYDVGIGNYISGRDSNNQPVISTDPTGCHGIYSASYPSGYWGDGNVQVDTEDLDANDFLDAVETHYEYSRTINPGWNAIKIPLDQFTTIVGGAPDSTSLSFMTNVKHMRMWLTGTGDAEQTGYVQFESIVISLD